MTNSSYDSNLCYEQLEFLGDTIIHMILTKYLFDRYSTDKRCNEGVMTNIR